MNAMPGALRLPTSSSFGGLELKLSQDFTISALPTSFPGSLLFNYTFDCIILPSMGGTAILYFDGMRIILLLVWYFWLLPCLYKRKLRLDPCLFHRMLLSTSESGRSGFSSGFSSACRPRKSLQKTQTFPPLMWRKVHSFSPVITTKWWLFEPVMLLYYMVYSPKCYLV